MLGITVDQDEVLLVSVNNALLSDGETGPKSQAKKKNIDDQGGSKKRKSDEEASKKRKEEEGNKRSSSSTASVIFYQSVLPSRRSRRISMKEVQAMSNHAIRPCRVMLQNMQNDEIRDWRDREGRRSSSRSGKRRAIGRFSTPSSDRMTKSVSKTVSISSKNKTVPSSSKSNIMSSARPKPTTPSSAKSKIGRASSKSKYSASSSTSSKRNVVSLRNKFVPQKLKPGPASSKVKLSATSLPRSKPGPASSKPNKPGPASSKPNKPGPASCKPNKPGPASSKANKPGPASSKAKSKPKLGPASVKRKLQRAAPLTEISEDQNSSSLPRTSKKNIGLEDMLALVDLVDPTEITDLNDDGVAITPQPFSQTMSFHSYSSKTGELSVDQNGAWNEFGLPTKLFDEAEHDAAAAAAAAEEKVKENEVSTVTAPVSVLTKDGVTMDGEYQIEQDEAVKEVGILYKYGPIYDEGNIIQIWTCDEGNMEYYGSEATILTKAKPRSILLPKIHKTHIPRHHRSIFACQMFMVQAHWSMNTYIARFSLKYSYRFPVLHSGVCSYHCDIRYHGRTGVTFLSNNGTIVTT